VGIAQGLRNNQLQIGDIELTDAGPFLPFTAQKKAAGLALKMACSLIIAQPLENGARCPP